MVTKNKLPPRAILLNRVMTCIGRYIRPSHKTNWMLNGKRAARLRATRYVCSANVVDGERITPLILRVRGGRWWIYTYYSHILTVRSMIGIRNDNVLPLPVGASITALCPFYTRAAIDLAWIDVAWEKKNTFFKEKMVALCNFYAIYYHGRSSASSFHGFVYGYHVRRMRFVERACNDILQSNFLFVYFTSLKTNNINYTFTEKNNKKEQSNHNIILEKYIYIYIHTTCLWVWGN